MLQLEVECRSEKSCYSRIALLCITYITLPVKQRCSASSCRHLNWVYSTIGTPTNSKQITAHTTAKQIPARCFQLVRTFLLYWLCFVLFSLHFTFLLDEKRGKMLFVVSLSAWKFSERFWGRGKGVGGEDMRCSKVYRKLRKLPEGNLWAQASRITNEDDWSEARNFRKSYELV